MKYTRHVLLVYIAFYGALQTVDALTCTVADQATVCTGLNVIATCDPTKLVCNCAPNYGPTPTGCGEIPIKPVLTVEGDTAVFGDLSIGADYTLKCASTTGGSTYELFKDGVKISNGKLTAVNAATKGLYTCKATKDSLTSDASDGMDITVGAAGKKCAKAEDCDGASPNLVGTCTSERCNCKGGYTALKATCTEIPIKPVLTVEGDTAVFGDLSIGADYTLKCASTTGGSTYEFFKDGVKMSNGKLTAVNAATKGSYTCKATKDSLTSDVSDGKAITVGAAGKKCATAEDCDGASTHLVGTCTSERCNCKVGYTALKATCAALPATPVLTVEGDTKVVGDLSIGADYTLKCTSDTANSQYLYFKDGVKISNGKLAAVSAATKGSYTCKATKDSLTSDASGGMAITIGVAGKKCVNNADCGGDGTNETKKCTGKRCVCKDGYKPMKAMCSVAVPMATFSVITFITAFIASRLI